MRDFGRQITTLQSQMTTAVQNGETENSPHLRQMDARLEWMRRLWATHRQLRLGLPAANEGCHASHIA
jgi:hypothetical protein